MGFDYNGRKPFSRERRLEENQLEQYKDAVISNAFGQVDERAESTDKLFSDLAKTYLKGNKLITALSKMDPAQFIPIEEFADTTRSAAIRISPEESQKGTVITYSLYQRAVSIILEKKWEIRGTVINMKLPASSSQTDYETTQKLSNAKPGNMIKEFISQNGIISTILGMLTLSPFQTVIFQALGVEEGAKGIQIAQIPAGLALFLELGIKAERIIEMLKAAKITTPLVEEQLNVLSKSEEARKSAFSSIGINYDDFKKSQEFKDSENIVAYVSEYYTRYGGLDRPDGHLSIDHWIAYLNVAQNQQTIRGSLNTSHTFSPKFNSIKEQYTKADPERENIFTEQNRKHSNIFAGLAGTINTLNSSSSTMYDDIANSFNYYLTDRQLCCLVQVFGAIGNPDMLLTVASLLRLLASSLAGQLASIQNAILRLLGNLAQDALFELAANINKVYYKIAHRITKAFTVDFDNLPACNGMFTLAWALLQSVNTIFDQFNKLIRELSSIIGSLGNGGEITWEVAADRRHLLGIARILEVLARRLDMANACELATPTRTINNQITDSSPEFDQAIFTILGSIPPIIPLSKEDKEKYFDTASNKTSERLKYTYGIVSEQNSETEFGNCYSPDQKDRINKLIKNITTSLSETFNG